MPVEIDRIGGSLGAVVTGVDLRRPLTEAVYAQIFAALMDHQVLFFRDQDLDDTDQLNLAAEFGEISTYPITALLGTVEKTRRLSYIEDTEQSPPDADGWHTDVTWIEDPPAAALLSARVIPSYGGDTVWASLYRAYELLSPVMQRVCDGLSVRHWYGPAFEQAVVRAFGEEIRPKLAAAFPPVVHPLVRVHPISGRKALFVAGGFMDEIVDLHPEESAVLLDFLKARVDNPNVQCRWHWRPNDLALWDERCTNHRALSDHYPQHRVMRRCTMDTTRVPAGWTPAGGGG
ncbi:MAG TPA: TauD/TfdA family dioxygenase [Acidimicrobiales bacterium]